MELIQYPHSFLSVIILSIFCRPAGRYDVRRARWLSHFRVDVRAGHGRVQRQVHLLAYCLLGDVTVCSMWPSLWAAVVHLVSHNPPMLSHVISDNPCMQR